MEASWLVARNSGRFMAQDDGAVAVNRYKGSHLILKKKDVLAIFAVYRAKDIKKESFA